MTAKTMAGLEEILASELAAIGAQDIQQGVRVVTFSGDKKVLYKANLHLRTALKILVPIATFRAKNEQQLYNQVKALTWKDYLNIDDTFSVNAVVHSKLFNHSHYLALKTKDAIADQFRNYYGKRPNVDKDNPDLSIDVHCREDYFTISIDSSGDSLHKRGYRIEEVAAPLSEVLAAGMILLTGWDKKSTFVDPMCGSGTIAIEAALMARNIAPGIFRKGLGFQKWKSFQPQLWNEVLKEAKDAELPVAETPFIFAYEISEKVARSTKANIESAGLSQDIVLSVSDFHQIDAPAEPGTLIVNPPYGERLKPQDIANFYSSIGDTFKSEYAGFKCWILSSNMAALKTVGLRPTRKIPLYNGKLECKFQKYEIYEGSKKQPKPEDIEREKVSKREPSKPLSKRISGGEEDA